MKRFLIMSVLFATFWIPLALARKEGSLRALRSVQKRFLVFCAVYVVTILYVLPRI
ncbi:MAG TPA: hypothetical protein VFZ53_11275 [Polyangiaceae bacterium]